MITVFLEKVKPKNKLGVGNPKVDKSNNGRDLIKQASSSQ